jgi:ubiquinone/menaquinone biosynthesis C-methylase UbiE
VTTAGTGLTANVVAAFDEAAGEYDSNGMGFAGPIASRLVELAGLRPGWRVLDAGCGAGAVLLRAARAVSPGGHVAGVDLSPRMLARAAREAERTGLGPCITLSQGDAAEPAFGPASFDAILASLVFYLLADPAAALARWHELLVPGGTLAFSRAVATDPRWSPVIAAVDAYATDAPGFESYVHRPGPLLATTAMLDACGYADVASTVETITFRYDSPQQWWETAASEGPWVTWRHIPARRLAEARAEAIAMAGELREPDGSLRRRIRMAFLTARRAEGG